MSNSNKRIASTITLPNKLHIAVDRYAIEKKLTFSLAIAILLGKLFDVTEEEILAGAKNRKNGHHMEDSVVRIAAKQKPFPKDSIELWENPVRTIYDYNRILSKDFVWPGTGLPLNAGERMNIELWRKNYAIEN